MESSIREDDSAGLAELMDLEKLHFPDNFRILHLPNIALANNYPTLGPNGEYCLNINGQACSIELYLGADVLSNDGKLIPVHWKGYNDKTKTYQGEVMQKGLIQSKFFNKCKTPENGNQILEYDDNWTEMRLLLNCLFNAFAPSN